MSRSSPVSPPPAAPVPHRGSRPGRGASRSRLLSARPRRRRRLLPSGARANPRHRRRHQSRTTTQRSVVSSRCMRARSKRKTWPSSDPSSQTWRPTKNGEFSKDFAPSHPSRSPSRSCRSSSAERRRQSGSGAGTSSTRVGENRPPTVNRPLRWPRPTDAGSSSKSGGRLSVEDART